MSDRRRGIVDPWRRVEPLRAPAPVATPRPARQDLDDIDRDADLAIPGSYTLRAKHAAFTVTAVQLTKPRDALEILIACVDAARRLPVLATALRTAGLGVQTAHGAWNPPATGVATSMLASAEMRLWCHAQTLDEGLRALARVLRLPAAVPLCRHHHIVVMLTA